MLHCVTILLAVALVAIAACVVIAASSIVSVIMWVDGERIAYENNKKNHGTGKCGPDCPLHIKPVQIEVDNDNGR